MLIRKFQSMAAALLAAMLFCLPAVHGAESDTPSDGPQNGASVSDGTGAESDAPSDESQDGTSVSDNTGAESDTPSDGPQDGTSVSDNTGAESDTPSDGSQNGTSVSDDTGADDGSSILPKPTQLITAITDENGVPVDEIPPVIFPLGGSDLLEQKILGLVTVLAKVEGEDEPLELEVDWFNWLMATEYDVFGSYTAAADIGIPEGYTLADGVPSQISVSYTVEPTVIQSFENLSDRFAFAIAQNGDWQELMEGYLSGWVCECLTAEGNTLYADIKWTDPQPDLSQPGLVTVPGELILPEGAALAEGVEPPAVRAVVSIQGKPTLECWSADASALYIPWVMGELEDRWEELTFMASVDGGGWEDAGEWIDTNGESVYIVTNYLMKGSSYQVKVTWNGGETNAFEFTWDGAVTDAGPVGGDRDGGDGDGNPSEDIIQTRPEPDSETVSTSRSDPEAKSDSEVKSDSDPVSEPDSEPFYEEVTDTYSLFSGTRILMMREGGAVRFSKQGVTVSLSDAALDGMALTDDSRLLLQLEATDQGFALLVELDGAPLAALPDTSVLLPVDPPAGRLLLLDEQGGIVCEGSYDPSLGVGAFTIQVAGNYTVAQASSQDEAALDDGAQSSAPLAGQGDSQSGQDDSQTGQGSSPAGQDDSPTEQGDPPATSQPPAETPGSETDAYVNGSSGNRAGGVRAADLREVAASREISNRDGSREAGSQGGHEGDKGRPQEAVPKDPDPSLPVPSEDEPDGNSPNDALAQQDVPHQAADGQPLLPSAAAALSLVVGGVLWGRRRRR